MRTLLLLPTLLLCAMLHAQDVVVRVNAASYPGQVASLYRYDDLFTMRAVRLADAPLGDDGVATLTVAVQGTTKLRLRVGDVTADLYARPGAQYNITFPPPDPRMPRSLNGTTHTAIEFTDLDPLDVNALTSDLNDRIDAFIMEDLATDEVAGMQAVGLQRTNNPPTADTTQRPATLFVTPTWSALRVDTFERKVRNFYRDVNDPWFAHYITYSFAGLRHGPRVNEEELFKNYVKDKPVVYDDPEYVRFLRSFYSEHLQAVQRFHAEAMQRAFTSGEADSLKALLATNEFLKNDPRLTELVMIDQLYQQYHGNVVQREGAERILADVAATSSFPEHRTIATNILWDLTAMRVGSRLPAMLLEDLRENTVVLDSMMPGPVCIAITASWCSYCELEMQGLQQLRTEYKDVVRIIVINLDADATQLAKYVKAHPGMDFQWLRAMAERQLRDDLRLRSLPAFYLLNDGALARSPAPFPSNGLGALFQQAKVAAEKGMRVKVWDD